MKKIRIVSYFKISGMVMDIKEFELTNCHIKSGKFNSGLQWAFDSGIAYAEEGCKVEIEVIDN